MDEVKFTKGPWSEIPQHAAGPMIARVIETGQQMTPTRLRLIAHILQRGDSLPEDRANARLIAASPDLHDELSVLVRLWYDHAADSVEFSDAIECAANLLEKVRGEL